MSKEFKGINYKITINHDDCIGCGACTSDCPLNVFELIDGKSHATRVDDCCSTLACTAVCPVNCITVEELH